MKQINFFYKIPSEPEYNQVIGGLITKEEVANIISGSSFRIDTIFNNLLSLSHSELIQLFKPFFKEWEK